MRYISLLGFFLTLVLGFGVAVNAKISEGPRDPSPSFKKALVNYYDGKFDRARSDLNNVSSGEQSERQILAAQMAIRQNLAPTVSPKIVELSGVPQLKSYVDIVKLQLLTMSGQVNLGQLAQSAMSSKAVDQPHIRYCMILGDALIKAMDYGTAKALFCHIKKLPNYPVTDVKTRLIQIAMNVNDSDSAITECRLLMVNNVTAATKIWPDLVRKWPELPSINALLVQPSDYIAVLNQWVAANSVTPGTEIGTAFLSRFPTDSRVPLVLDSLGILAYQSFNFDQAIGWYSKLLATNPAPGLWVKSTYYIARSHQRLKRFQVAEPLFISIIRDHPQSPYLDESYYYLYELMLAQGRESDFNPYLAGFKNATSQSEYYNKIIWEKGVLAVKNNKFQDANQIFDRRGAIGSDSLKSRLLFWSAKSAYLCGFKAVALNRFQACINQFPLSFSSYRSLHSGIFSETEIATQTRQISTMFAPKNIQLSPKYAWGIKMGFGDLVVDEIKSIIRSQQSGPSQQMLFDLATVYQQMGKVYQSIQLLSANSDFMSFSIRKGIIPKEIAKLLYPLEHWDSVSAAAAEFDIDPLLILSVIRAESAFHPTIVSRTGAVGLMQIMPATGQGIASNLQQPWNVAMLTDPATNIRFGTFYLSSLKKRLDGNIVLMLCGYNGGPNAAKKWSTQYDIADIDKFILNIPFPETQYYVQKVMQNLWIYQMLYPEAVAAWKSSVKLSVGNHAKPVLVDPAG